MAVTTNRWVRCVAEHRRKLEADQLPRGIRGIYVLFRERRATRRYDVVYVGLSKTGMRARIMAHRRNKKKSDLWTHFSVFVVWENVMDAEIAELEGLFRHIYRGDTNANRLNMQKLHLPFKRARVANLSDLKRG